MLLRSLPLALICLVAANASKPSEQFSEELKLRPLRDGRVAARFSFKTLLPGAVPRNPSSLGSDDESQHYTLFPLALGQILREYALTELHLTLNAGSWNYDRWGYPDELSVGTGAEVWTWMADGIPSTIDSRWEGLRNSLAGLFCASLGSLDEQRTTSTESLFQPEGLLPDWGNATRHQLRHASHPSENVCTENLTPFLKLLPCKSLSGIATLLNPHKIFDADWHGLGVHVLWLGEEGIEVRLTFQAVLDPFRFSSEQSRDWSLGSLFDRTIQRRCPVASSSVVTVVSAPYETLDLHPVATTTTSHSALFDILSTDLPFDLHFKQKASQSEWPAYMDASDSVPLSIQRSLRGATQAYGELSVSLRNREDHTINAIYLETMPWLVQFYIHTLEARLNGSLHDGLVSIVEYIPSLLHSRPLTLQLAISIPAHSTVRLTWQVAKSFLLYTDHPPDAQRGWDLPPAILLPLNLPNASDDLPSPSSSPRRIYTSTLLVDLATPDFSMPYNVIIFSCSLIAFLFGSIFNLLTRKFVIVKIS